MDRRPVVLLVALVLLGTCIPLSAAEPAVAFLAPESQAEKLGPEARAARQLAEKVASAALVLPAAEGKFVDTQGREVELAKYRVVWHHQGDSTAQSGPLYQP